MLGTIYFFLIIGITQFFVLKALLSVKISMLYLHTSKEPYYKMVNLYEIDDRKHKQINVCPLKKSTICLEVLIFQFLKSWTFLKSRRSKADFT